VYIPKQDGRQRPDPEAFPNAPTYPLISRSLQYARGQGIAALEDKIVQQAVVTILNEIYEVDFRGLGPERRGKGVLIQ
jgi:hypothetical protein